MASVSLSLDSSLKPSLSAPHHHRFSPSSLSCSSLQCSTAPLTTYSRTFLSPLSLSKQQTLLEFSQPHHFSHGTLLIRPMLETEMDAVAHLLEESFTKTNLLLDLHDRRRLLPHAAVLVGIYSHDDVADELACTAEIFFDERGADSAFPTPVPPPECPYICNLTVKNSLRRKGIGKQLLKTCEDLICKMTEKRDVYLHCRMVDKMPLSMYKKAGYQIVNTESFLVWLTRKSCKSRKSRKRRNYLMRKTLPANPEEMERENPSFPPQHSWKYRWRLFRRSFESRRRQKASALRPPLFHSTRFISPYSIRAVLLLMDLATALPSYSLVSTHRVRMEVL